MSAEDWHRRIEAVKLAYADRDAFIADPELADVPVEQLLSDDYADVVWRLLGLSMPTWVVIGLGGLLIAGVWNNFRKA